MYISLLTNCVHVYTYVVYVCVMSKERRLAGFDLGGGIHPPLPESRPPLEIRLILLLNT